MSANPTYDFSGQVALVTGAGGGIGLAAVNAFAAAGAAVVLVDRDEELLRTATNRLESEGHRAIAMPCDVSNEAQIRAVWREPTISKQRTSDHARRSHLQGIV